jgi:glycosyltransferase involved in cell wall biosynthesis
MDLIINSVAALGSSLGVRRFFTGVMQHLAWPAKVEITKAPRFRAFARASELLQVGRKDAIYWSPTHRGPLRAHHHVVSVHDCINIEYTYRDDWRLPAFRRLFNVVLDRSEAIVALSHATRSAILRNYKIDESKIVVIPAGFDMPAQASGGLLHTAESVDPPFVLMVTNALPHKNTSRACRAFADSRAREKGTILRVVGSVAPDGLENLSRAGIKVDLHDHVDDSTLMDWYRTCNFFFSPSLAEGYNLPIAEAISAGANVLCSDIPVHREFYSGQATFFDPARLDAMVEALNTALARSGRWHDLIDPSKQRSFRDMAADYRALFEQIATKARDRPPG